MAKKDKILQPVYFQKFQCTGSSCEDSCCEKWRITIDKKTYQRYKNCPDVKLRSKLAKHITRNRSNPSNANYAKIKLNKDNICPFMAEDKLCDIQRNLGEEYLSVTCNTYPRIYNIVNGILEKSLCVSCPEVARLVLLDRDLMEFELVEQAVNLECYSIESIITNDAKGHNFDKVNQYFDELRIFTISTLQNRSYPLWQRLIVLGLFCSKLDKLIKDSQTENTLKLIEDYRNHLEQGELGKSLENISNKLIVQIKVLDLLLANRAIHVKDKKFLEYLEQAQQGIEYSTECSEEENSAKYILAYEKYYLPVASKHEYIMENYLVNYVFMNTFPLSGQKNFFDNYVMLVTNYAAIKLLLIGIAKFYKEEFSAEHMIGLIQCYAKNILHSSLYLKSVADFLKDNKIDNLAYMSILIKN